MKKIIPVIFVFFLIYGLTNEAEILIPNNAIRFRVIASDNTLASQQQKIQVKELVEDELNEMMSQAKTSEEAKTLISQNLQSIREKVNSVTKDNQVNFGQNYFPSKEYHGVTYPEGNYESLVITLGNGTGNNWWCVMFPPLCLIETNQSNLDDVEYKFLIKDLLDKY